MDVRLANSFIDAFMFVMSGIGCPTPKRLRLYVRDRNALNSGVAVKVDFTRQMSGSVVYNMREDTAKFIASTMMMGMPVIEFDEIAQSAISELSNMLSANAATNLTKLGIDVDISTPQLNIGAGAAINVSDSQFLVVAMDVGGHRVDIDIAAKIDVPI